ncbi:MAG: hypothetical protein IPO07_24315 [Haliscomenobacter sp.]|nr:hypothetical protein [Haliscomenobacter sp.]MBK9491569.1 hypothetical protein [Haliscomenobacter sp.]
MTKTKPGHRESDGKHNKPILHQKLDTPKPVVWINQAVSTGSPVKT